MPGLPRPALYPGLHSLTGVHGAHRVPCNGPALLCEHGSAGQPPLLASVRDASGRGNTAARIHAQHLHKGRNVPKHGCAPKHKNQLSIRKFQSLTRISAPPFSQGRGPPGRNYRGIDFRDCNKSQKCVHTLPCARCRGDTAVSPATDHLGANPRKPQINVIPAPKSHRL